MLCCRGVKCDLSSEGKRTQTRGVRDTCAGIIFETKGNETTEGWRKLHVEQFVGTHRTHVLTDRTQQ
jgi:hypothetical protein